MTTDPLDQLRASDPAAGVPVDKHAILIRTHTPAGRRLWLPRVAQLAAVGIVTAGAVTVGYSLGAPPAGAPVANEPTHTAPATVSPAAPEHSEPYLRTLVGDTAMVDPSYYPGGQRTVFTADTLPAGPATASMFALDATALPTRLADIAAAFAITATPTEHDGYWTATSPDGAVVHYYPSADGAVSFYNPAIDPWYCPDPGGGVDGAPPAEPTPEPAGEPGTDRGAIAPYDPAPCELRDVTTPDDATTLSAAADQLTALGFTPADFTVTIAPWSDQTYRQVEATRDGLTWSFTYVGGQLQSAYGPMATIIDLGTYPIISPTDAVARLTDPLFTNTWSGPVRYATPDTPGTVTADAPAPTEPAGAPTPPTPGQPLDWPVTTVHLTGATLTHARYYTNTGAIVLAPTWELTDASGNAWATLALAEDALNTTG